MGQARRRLARLRQVLLARSRLCYPRAVPSKLPASLAVGSFLAILAAAAPARADASAWVFIGGGTLAWKQGVEKSAATSTTTVVEPGNDGAWLVNGTMVIEAGVGTRPDAPVIFGGLFRLQPVFQHGTDLALLARGCTRGFQAGSFGFAVDAGGYLRTWGPQLGAGFAGGISLGLPLGFTVSVHTEIGSNNALSVGAVAGLDLLRLTVYREALKTWWQNPSPSWPRESDASARF